MPAIRFLESIGRVDSHRGLMSPNESPISHLRKQRALLIERLRKVAPDLVEELESWDRAIVALESKDEPAAFARHLSGADALAEYLEANGPQHRLVAIKAVAAGGWASNRRDPIGILHDAVDYQLGKSHNPKIVSLGGDMIGTPEQKKSRRMRN